MSVLELMAYVESITGNKNKSVMNKMRRADKLVMYLDIRKAKDMLGWEPKVSKKQGVRRLASWIKKISGKN